MKLGTLATLLGIAAVGGSTLEYCTSQDAKEVQWRRTSGERIALQSALNKQMGGGWEAPLLHLSILERVTTDGRFTHNETVWLNDGFAEYTIKTTTGRMDPSTYEYAYIFNGDLRRSSEGQATERDKKIGQEITATAITGKEDFRSYMQRVAQLVKEHTSQEPAQPKFGVVFGLAGKLGFDY